MKPHAVVDTTPEVVQDFELLPPRSTTRYELTLADEHVELLARGIVPEAVSRRAYQMLEWKRMHNRALARASLANTARRGRRAFTERIEIMSNPSSPVDHGPTLPATLTNWSACGWFVLDPHDPSSRPVCRVVLVQADSESDAFDQAFDQLVSAEPTLAFLNWFVRPVMRVEGAARGQ